MDNSNNNNNAPASAATPSNIPPEAIQLNQDALVAISQRDFDTALYKYTAAIQLMPQNAVLYWNRAGVFFEKTMYNEALRDAQAALRLAPQWIQAYYRCGFILMQMKRHEDAIHIFRLGLEQDPDSQELLDAIHDAKNALEEIHEKLREENNEQTTEMTVKWKFVADDCIAQVAHSPDGRFVAIATLEGTIYILKADTGESYKQLPGHNFGTLSLSFSPDSTMLASGGQDGKCCIWEIQKPSSSSSSSSSSSGSGSGDSDDTTNSSTTTTTAAAPLVSVKAGSSWVQHVRWSPKGDLIATASGKFLKLWTPLGAESVHKFEPHASTITGLEWHISCTRLFTASYSYVNEWDIPSRGESSSSSSDENATTNLIKPSATHERVGSLLSFACSPDCVWLATGTQDACVHVWNLKTDKNYEMDGYQAKVQELCFTPCSSFLCTGGGPDAMVWDLRNKEKGPAGSEPRVLRAHYDNVTDIKCSHNQIESNGAAATTATATYPTYIIATAGADGQVFLWSSAASADRAFRKCDICSLTNADPEDNKTKVEKVDFSPDDKTIVVGYSTGEVVAWNTQLL